MNLIFTLLKSIFNFQKYLVSGSLLVLLFITALSNNSWGYNNFIFNLQVSFSTTPSDDDNDGQILICEGATVLFTDTSTDVPPGAIYSWSFPGGSFTSADTPGPHNVTFDSAGSYIVSLDIDGVISELTVNVDESTEIEPEIAVDNWGQSMFNGVDYFTWCSTAQAGATFSFETTSTNTSPNSLHTLTTGSDLIASFTGENNPLIEYYFSDPGYYQINYVIQEGSCFFESNFELYIGAPPTASISNDGVPILCTSGFVEYEITPGAQNGPGTLYTIEVSDGSDPVVFNHPPPATYTHYYSSVSCGQNDVVFNDTPYPNSFEISITAENACGQSTNGFAPIYIESGPEAQFEFVPNPTNNTICQDVTLTVNDTTTPGSNITSGECDDSYKRFWQIEAPNGSILTSGSNGSIDPNPYATVIGNMGFVPTGIDPNAESASSWFASASTSIDITFLQPGNYEVTLFAGSAGQSNRCGISSYTEVICVTPEVIADFELSTYSVCGPQNVLTTNNSSQTACDNSNIYQWDVSFENPENCPLTSSPNWEFLSGNASSFQPEFQFNTPGVYEITLTVSLDTASGETVCEPDSITKTLIIKDKPQTILPAVELCEQENFTFDLELFDCYADQETSFSWDFQGSEDLVINDTNLLNPTISFSEPGIYPYSLTLTNECGANILSSSIEVYSQVLVTASGPSSVCVNSEISLNGTINGGATTGSWSSSIPGGSFSPSANDLSAIYTPPTDYVGSVILTLTSEDPFGPCPSVSEVVEVDVQLQATSDAGVYDPFCINIPIQLAGILGGAASSGTWSADVPGTFSDETDLNATFTPTTDFTGNITFTLTTDDPPGPCSNNFDLATVEVIPIGQVNPLNDVIFCNNENTNIILFSTSEPGTTFSWTNDNIAIGLAASGVDEIPSFTANNLETFPITATITVTPTITSGSTSCDGIPETFTITINPSAQVDDPVDLVLCHEEVQSEIIFSTQNTGGSTTYDWSIDTGVGLSPTTGTGNIPSFTAVNTGTSPIIATVTVTPTFSNGGVDCDGTPETFTITVNPSAQVDDPVDLVLCHEEVQSEIIFSTQNTGGSTTYDWSIDTGVGLSPTTGTGNIPSFTAVNTGTSPIIATVTVTPTFSNGGVNCDGTPETFTITINPSAQVDDPVDLVLCHEEVQSEIIFSTQNTGGSTTYDWSIDTGVGLSPTTGTGNIPSFTAVNTGTSPIIATVTVTPTFSNGGVDCDGTPETFTITINPSAQVDDPVDLVLCHEEVQSEIIFSTQNTGGSTTYDWSIDTGVGLSPTTGTGNIPSFTAVNTGTSPIIATVTVTPTFSNGGVDCDGTPETFTITVNPRPIMDAVDSQTICGGTAFETPIYNSNISDVSYSWELISTNIPSEISGFPTPNGSGELLGNVIQNSGNVSITLDYNLTVSYAGCVGNTVPFSLTVNPSPIVTISPPESQSLCLNGNFESLVVDYNYVGNFDAVSYQWYYNTQDSTDLTGATLISGATTSSFTPPSDTIGTFYYFCVLAFSPPICENATTPTVQITVENPPSISANPEPTQSICVGGIIAENSISVSYNGGSGTPEYQWYVNTVNSYGGTAISDSNSPILDPGIFDTSGSYYYWVSISFPSGDGCGGIFSDLAEVVVVSDPIITDPLPTQIICKNTIPQNLIGSASEGTGDYSYQWYESPSDLPIAGATNSIFTPPTDVVGTFSYYYIVTTEASGCESISALAEVIVNETPTINLQPLAEQSVCLDGAITSLEVEYANGVGTPNYQWYSSSSCDTTDLSNPIANATASSFTPPSDAVGSINYFVVLSFQDGGCGEIISDCASVSVVQNPEITVTSNNPTPICVGGTIDDIEVETSGGVGTATYQWWISDVAGIPISQDINSSNAPSFNPGVFDNVGTFYYVAIVDFDGSGCNQAISSTITVEVVDNPVIETLIPTQVICEGTSPTALEANVSGGTGAYSYQWYESPSNLPISGATNTIFTPPTDVVGLFNYYVVVTTDASGCEATSTMSEVIVNEAPTVSVQPLPEQTVCLDGATTILEVDYSNGVGAPTYQWYSSLSCDTTDLSNPITGATFSSYTPPSDAVGSINYFVVLNFSDGGCGSIISQCAQVNVGEIPSIGDVSTTICSNEAFVVSPTEGGGLNSDDIVPLPMQYSWITTGNSNLTGWSNNSNQAEISQTLVNTTNVPQQIVYTITPTSQTIGNCTGETFDVTVTVNPTPAVSDKLISTCSSELIEFSPSGDGTGSSDIVPENTTYTWTFVDNPNVMGETLNTSGLNQFSQTLTNLNHTQQSVVYQLTPVSSLGCQGETFSITVNLDPVPFISDKSEEICSGEFFEIEPQNNLPNEIVPENTLYTWTTLGNSNLTGWSDESNAQTPITQALVNTTSEPQSINYSVTPQSGSCVGSTFNIVVNVLPNPQVDNATPSTQEICSGEASASVVFSSSVVGTGFEYTLVNTNIPNEISGFETNISGTGDLPQMTLINGLAEPYILDYEVVPTAEGCGGDPVSFSITINPSPQVVFDQQDQVLCNNDSSAVVSLNSTTSDVNFQWTRNTPVGLVGFETGDEQGDGIIPSFNLENTTNAPIDLVFTAIATTTGDAECPGPDAIYTITINPTAQINPIDDQIICSQSTFEDIFVTSPTQSNTSISYEWQVTSAGSNLSGYTAAGGPISISDPIVGEAIFNASNVAEELVYTITPYFDNCPGDPYVFTTVVNPTPEISNTQATICSEETFNILPENGLPTASTIVPENTTFTWVVQNNPNVIGQSNETVEQNSISQTLINLTNTPQNVIYNVTPTSVSGCEGASFELMVTVDPKPVIENKTIELCSGNSFVVEPIDDSPNEIVPSNTLYTWTVLAGADLADLSGFSNQTSPVSIMTQTLVNLTDQIKTIVYEVIPISDSCPGLPFQVEVNVGPSPLVNDIVLEPICSEDSIVVEPQTGFPDSNNIIPAGTTFTWTVVDNPNVIGEFNELTPQNQISQTLQNMSSVTQTLVYNVVPSSSGCDGSPFTVEVSVKPRPFIETGPEIQQTQCSTDQFVIAPEDGVPTASTIIPFGTQYTWVVSEPNSDLIGWSDQSTPVDVIAQTLENTTNQVQQITYTVTPEADGCIGPSFDVVISIEPKPFIPDVLTDICDNTAYTLVPQNGLEPDLNTIVPEVTRYSWSSPTLTSGLSGGSIGTDEVTFNSGVLENQTTSIQTAIYSVTPNYYLASDPTTIQCAGEPFNVTINVSPSPEINEVITNVTCSYSQPLCVGSIEISPVGMAPFSYSWVSLEGNPIANSSAEDLYGLCPGIYELTITDASNCSYVYQYEISPPEPVDFTLISLTDISCNNVNSQPCDGSIEVSTTGGTAPYSLVEWYTETTPGSGVFDFGPLINVDNPTRLINACQGNYILKVLDANGCEFVSPVYTVNQTVDAIVISDSFSSFNGFNIDCFGANSGSITADISGGSGVFDYTFIEDSTGTIIESDTVLTTPAALTFEFLVSGNYTLTITDPNCANEIVKNYFLTQPDELIITATLVDPVACFGGLATYDVTAVGGVPPYNGTGLQSVLSGPATFEVSDANGCQDDFSTVVFEPEELLATFQVNDALCFGDTGTIAVTPTGGSGILTVNLFDSDNDFITSLNTTQGATATFDQLQGSYFYTVVDANNCEYGPEAVMIDEPDPITITDFEVIQPDCNTTPAWAFNNGSICITITGGTNPFPTGVGWVNSGGGQWCLNNLAEGSYTIDVTDQNNCTLENPIPDITLVRPPEITAVLTSTLDIDCDNDTATQINTIIINGGVPPYQVTWSGGNVDAANPFVMETTEAGNYSAFVNDQYGIINGCPPIEFPLDPITFFEFGFADFTTNSINSDFCGVFAVSDPITFTNISTGDVVNYTWNFGDGSPLISNIENPTHIYDVIGEYVVSLTVEDEYGCFDTYSQTIDITKGYEIILPNAFTPNGDGVNETIRPVYNCMTKVQMSVYDTWGSLIYAESSDVDGNIYGWDGTIDGTPAENGNYIMVVRAVVLNGTVIDLNGPVTLIK